MSATTVSRRKKVFDDITLHLRNAIRSGELAPGMALPSENQLVQEYGISRMSVRSALQALEKEQLIRRCPGKGRFVRDLTHREREQESRAIISIGLDIGADYPWYGAAIAHGIKSGVFAGHDCRLVLLGRDEYLRLSPDMATGVVLAGIPDAPSCATECERLQAAGVVPVLFNRIREDERVPYVAVHYRHEAERAVRELVRRGRQRIALVVGKTALNEECINPRALGYCDALGISRKEAETATFHVDDDRTAPEQLERFLREYRPDAIFVTYGFIAPVVFQVALRLGLRLPEDLTILCFDDLSHLQHAVPGSFLYVRMPLEQMGRDAAEFIARQSTNPGGEVLKKLYQARLVDTAATE